mgnify:CR=1 FL=1
MIVIADPHLVKSLRCLVGSAAPALNGFILLVSSELLIWSSFDVFCRSANTSSPPDGAADYCFFKNGLVLASMFFLEIYEAYDAVWLDGISVCFSFLNYSLKETGTAWA